LIAAAECLQWTIKAKLVRKAPPRSFNSRAGTPSRVFNVELADAAVSGQIQKLLAWHHTTHLAW
jgi:hypothetical protein